MEKTQNDCDSKIDSEVEDSMPQADSDASKHSTNADEGVSRGFNKTLIILVALLGMAAAFVWFAIRQSQQVPSFYASVLQVDYELAQKEGQRFERNLLHLQNASRRPRPWKVIFTQSQVNGWFAIDLPEKFPEAMPNAIKQPRLVFCEDEIKLAFKYDFRGVSGYVVLKADVFCTSKPNEVAIQIMDVRTGFIPLPVGPWMEKVANSIRNVGIPVSWSRIDGDPVAIFTLPETTRNKKKLVVQVEAINLIEEQMIIAGLTELASNTNE